MNYRFDQLINLEQLRKLLDSHNGFSGMAYGLFDTDENNLLAVGWQDICTQFHRVHPVSCARCRESDAFLKTHLNSEKGQCLEYRCKNGMIDVAMPIMLEGRHLATFFTGQFFYEGEQPDREFFIRQADELGFERDAYLAALDRVPVFSREHIRSNILFLHNMVEVLAELGLANVKQIREVEERKRVEERYRINSNLLQTIFESSSGLIAFALDANCNYLTFNTKHKEVMMAIWGVEIAIGMNMLEVISDAADRERARLNFNRALSGENFILEEWYGDELLTRNYWQNCYSPIRSDNGTIIGLTCFILNITERKQMEESLAVREREFRTLAENLPDNVARYDREGRTVYINPALEKTLGTTNADVIGTHVREFFPDGSFEIYAQAIDTVLDSDKDIEIEFTVSVPNKEVAVHQIRIIAEHNEHGEVIGVLAIGRDITERKLMEEQLKQALDFSTGIINALPDILFEVDRYGTYLNVWTQNPAVLATQREVLLGKTVHEVLTQDNAAAAMKAIDDANENGVSYGNVICIMQQNGESRWYEHSLAKKRGSTPADDSFIVLSRDITERKKAEERLQEMKNRLSTIFATIPDMVWLKDKDGVYLACNTAFEEFSGAVEADLIGKTDYDIMDVEQADCCRKSDYDAIWAGDVCFSEEEVVYGVDGRRGLLEIRKVPVYGVHGEVAGVMGIGRDITERKQMEQVLFAREQEFHTLVENAPDAVFRYDRDCRRIYLNPAAQRLLQIPASGLLGRAPLETPLHWPVAFYQEMLRKVLDSGEESEFELPLKRADREQDIYMHVRLAPEYDANSHVCGVLAIGRDITERKRMEEDLQRKNSELERFTYTVSHDLKSPVITIKSFSGSIKNDLKSGRHDRVEKDLDRICTAADKMTLLLDDLLKLSRSGKVIDAPVPVDMRQLVNGVLKGLDGALQESGVQIVVQADLPTVQCDRQRMAEVLQNLIENAIKYRGNQPQPRIVIGQRQDGDQQVFFVQDNGPGIDPKYHENIFGLFNRLETKVPGTGVGLALVKRIIEVHGGRVWVESDGCGNGSTFCFTVG